MNSHPKVSVIIPSFNHKKYIAETLSSIQAQTYPNIETIVIDDGSTDGSPEYLKLLQERFQFQLQIKKNEGLCATINRGLEVAHGEYVVIIASDDFMPPERIAQQRAYLEKSDFDAIAGGMTLVDDSSRQLRYVSPLKQGSISFSDMLDKNVIFAPTVMFKSSTFLKFGKYNPEHYIEDFAMWLHILSKDGQVANFDHNWAYYRTTPVISRKKIDWYYKGLAQVFSQYLDRPGVSEALLKGKFKYLIKVAVLDGFQELRKTLKNDMHGLGLLREMFLYCVALAPAFIRNHLKKRINRI